MSLGIDRQVDADGTQLQCMQGAEISLAEDLAITEDCRSIVAAGLPLLDALEQQLLVKVLVATNSIEVGSSSQKHDTLHSHSFQHKI